MDDHHATDRHDLSLVIYDPRNVPSPPPSPRRLESQWSPYRSFIIRLLNEGHEAPQIVRALEREHDFDSTCHELSMMIRSWKLKRVPWPRGKKTSTHSKGIPRVPAAPIVFATPSNTNPTYLYRQAISDTGILLLGSCTKLHHELSLDIPDAIAGNSKDYDSTWYTSFRMSTEDIFLTDTVRFIWSIPEMFDAYRTLRGLLTYGKYFQDAEQLSRILVVILMWLSYANIFGGNACFSHETLRLLDTSSKLYKQSPKVLNNEILECYAKLDLAYVLRFQAQPLLGSVFEDSQRALSNDIIEVAATARSENHQQEILRPSVTELQTTRYSFSSSSDELNERKKLRSIWLNT